MVSGNYKSAAFLRAELQQLRREKQKLTHIVSKLEHDKNLLTQIICAGLVKYGLDALELEPGHVDNALAVCGFNIRLDWYPRDDQSRDLVVRLVKEKPEGDPEPQRPEPPPSGGSPGEAP